MTYVNGKTAVLTGAGSGIGRALAVQLNREGCELYLSDISADCLNETLAMLSRKEIFADMHVLDVAEKLSVHRWAENIAETRGHVDIVINNAGILRTHTYVVSILIPHAHIYHIPRIYILTHTLTLL